jgi:hypothetical protein
MTDAAASKGVEPPKFADALRSGWMTFKSNSKVLVASFGIFLGSSVVLALLLNLISGSLGWLLTFILSTASFLPSILLLPGLYSIALKATRGQKAEIPDLLLIFKDRFVQHVGLLLLQSCGAMLCVVGVVVSQALFVPGSFLVLDRRMDWDDAMGRCVEDIKPKLVNWIVFSLVLSLVAFAGFCACIVGALVTGPVALCAWAYAYEYSFGGRR